MPAEPMLSTADVARLLGFKSQTIRKMRLTGRGPAYHRIGGPLGRVVYARADVDAWLAATRFTSTSAEAVGTRTPSRTT